MYVFVPHQHQRMPSSRRQAIPSTRRAAISQGLELHGHPAPGLASSIWMIAVIALLAVGFLHGTIDSAVLHAFR